MRKIFQNITFSEKKNACNGAPSGRPICAYKVFISQEWNFLNPFNYHMRNISVTVSHDRHYNFLP